MRGVARARVTSSRRRTTLHGVRTFLLAPSRNGLGAPIAVSEANSAWSKENSSVLFLLVVFACVVLVLFLFLLGRTLIGSPREGIILGLGAILLRNLVFFRRAFIVGGVLVLVRDGFSLGIGTILPGGIPGVVIVLLLRVRLRASDPHARR